ncbi:MAG TPA: ATP-dependent metallopeptidase FtsH/Yme1/Tma family protein, partial [Symbiobacteriaceae bacterium]|nr:ATP-dependent metallopeptidase FtsH/Yme1/Tma family protein [Symbiobacteriaceae bacterium]
MNKQLRSLAFYMLLVVICVAVALQLGSPTGRVQSYDYSKFIQSVESGTVKSVTINGTRAEGELKDGGKFTVNLPEPQAQDELFATLTARVKADPNFVLKNERDSSGAVWTILLNAVLPLVLVVVAFFFIMQQTQGSGNRVMQFGKSRARLHTDDRKKVTFEDVAG